MKNVYVLLALFVSGILTSSAQLARIKPASIKKEPAISERRVEPVGGVNRPNAIIWYDDFGTPGTWGYSHAAGTTDDWIVGNTPPTGNNAINQINSTSAINGFALFDSDLLCSGNQNAYLTTTTPIDLTGHPNVRLSFEQYYARFRDSTFVLVSTDSMNWTKFVVNESLGINEFVESNSNVVDIDISSVAGNQATVWISFQYYSPSSLGVGAGCNYAWQIDDALIYDISDTDASVLRAFAGEYPMFPIIQPEALQLRGQITNYGLQPFSGAQLDFTVLDEFLNPLHVDTSASTGTLNPGDTSAVLNAWNGTYLVQDTGIFLIDQHVTLAGDTDTYNNTRRAFFYVSDSIYARDYFSINGRIGGNYGFNGGTGYMGQMFQIYNSSQITSASFLLTNPTVGDEVRVTFYSVASGAPSILLGTSANYTIQPSDTVSSFDLITLPFQSPINVTPGQYFVAINQIDTNFVSIGATKYVYSPGKVFYRGSASSTWTPFDTQSFFVSLILRLNNPSGTLLGVNEISKAATFSAYPNPTSGTVNIRLNKGLGKDVQVKVVNSIGQTVREKFFSSFMDESINLSDCAAGVYQIQVTSDNEQSSMNIVLE